MTSSNDTWLVHHSITVHITWPCFNQSAEQILVCQATNGKLIHTCIIFVIIVFTHTCYFMVIIIGLLCLWDAFRHFILFILYLFCIYVITAGIFMFHLRCWVCCCKLLTVTCYFTRKVICFCYFLQYFSSNLLPLTFAFVTLLLLEWNEICLL